MRTIVGRFTAFIAVVTAASLLTAGPAAAQVQSTDKQKCIVGLNKSGRKVSKATGKEAGRCIKDASRGQLIEPTADECVTNLKPKEAAARGKTTSTETKRCGVTPDFGFAGATAVNDAAEDAQNALVFDLFGPDLDGVILTGSDGRKCQQKVQRAWGKVVDRKMKVFEKCKKIGLKTQAIASAVELESCADAINYLCAGSITQPPPWASCSEPEKVAKAVGKLGVSTLKYCSGVGTGTAFPGVCAGSPDFNACVDATVECRVCLMLNEMDGIAIDCDTFDDGNGFNNSCPPVIGPTTTTTSTSTSTTNTNPTTTVSTTTTTLAVCGNFVVESGEDCDDGNTDPGDCCSPTCQADPAGTPCTSDGNECTDDECDGGGGCLNINNTDPCDDGLFCTGVDTCSGGTCLPAGDPCDGPDADGDCSENCDEFANDCNAIEDPPSGCDDGSCLPCGDGQRCVSAGGCESGVCSGGSLTMPPPWATCQTPSCSDAAQNGDESDVDCGGSCPACPAGAMCGSPGDCQSAVCTGSICQAPTCSDGVQNGDESDVDCGGSCPGCSAGGGCIVAGDCQSLVCTGNICQAATCSDGVQNGAETDVDCGGGACPTCPLFDSCLVSGDCTSNTCSGNLCKCGNQAFTFNVSSNSGGAFDSAEWPGGTSSQNGASGCSVTAKIPGDNIDLVCTLGGGGFAVNSFTGYSSCFGTGGEDGDGCQPNSCPPAGIGSCCSARPSCSAALNGSGSASYFVQCLE